MGQVQPTVVCASDESNGKGGESAPNHVHKAKQDNDHEYENCDKNNKI